MLSEVQRRMLELERSWWKYPAVKDTAIREQLGMTPARYYQVLSALLDCSEALAHDPTTVRRLQRLREQRRSLRDRRWATAS